MPAAVRQAKVEKADMAQGLCEAQLVARHSPRVTSHPRVCPKIEQVSDFRTVGLVGALSINLFIRRWLH